MSLIKKWLQIVETHKEDACLPFLKKLKNTEKKELFPTLEITAIAYLEIKDQIINNKHYFAKKASNKQERILQYSIFVIATDHHHSIHKWLDISYLINDYCIEHLFPWYCPSWMSNSLNQQAENKELSQSITYEKVLKMAKKGFIQPSDHLLAKLLPRVLFREMATKRQVYEIQVENLENHRDTLKKHIWLLFKYPTSLHKIEGQLNLYHKEQIADQCWYYALKKYAKTEQIDRLKLLEACLGAIINLKTFSVPAIIWFTDLFDYLQPKKQELLALQEALFATFSIPYSKQRNCMLRAVKIIAKSKYFEIDACLPKLDPLLGNTTKTLQLNTLQLLNILAEEHKAKRLIICQLATKALVHKEDKVQYKAAQIIKKYGTNYKSELSSIINKNINTLLYSSSQVLKEFELHTKQLTTDNQLFTKEKNGILSSKNKLKSISSLEDFIELTLPIFDQKKPYHFDQFLSGVLQYHKDLSPQNFEKLIPAFKRAYRLVFNELPINQGMLDNLLAVFFIDWANLLIQRYPKASKSLQKLNQKFLGQGFPLLNENESFDFEKTHLAKWYNPYDPSLVYEPTKLLLAHVLKTLNTKNPLPLLSLPTHAPSWINPLDLVNRLASYQEKAIKPNAIDLQIAISRMSFKNRSKALLAANKKLNQKPLGLVQFLLEKKAKLPAEISLYKVESTEESKVQNQENLDEYFYGYITAAITKSAYSKFSSISQLPDLQGSTYYYSGERTWVIFWEERRIEEWNYKTQRMEFVGKPYIHKELQLKTPTAQNIKQHPHFLYQYFPGNQEAFRPNYNDISRLLNLVPNNPEPLISLLISDNLKYPSFWTKDAQKRVSITLDWIRHYNARGFGQSIHLFLAISMLCNDSNIRQKAADIWKKSVPNKLINHQLLGSIIGKIECQNFAPLNRLTNIFFNDLLNFSTIHNHALEQLIVHILAKLPALPIKNTKKILILYRELLAINKSYISHKRVLILLSLWEEVPSLKKVILDLSKFVKK